MICGSPTSSRLYCFDIIANAPSCVPFTVSSSIIPSNVSMNFPSNILSIIPFSSLYIVFSGVPSKLPSYVHSVRLTTDLEDEKEVLLLKHEVDSNNNDEYIPDFLKTLLQTSSYEVDTPLPAFPKAQLSYQLVRLIIAISHVLFRSVQSFILIDVSMFSLG